MDEFPDPEEEYEIMHMEEMEAMMEMEREMSMVHKNTSRKKSKSSLNFDNVPEDDCNDYNELNEKNVLNNCDISIFNQESNSNSKSKSLKRNLSNSLIEITSDLEFDDNLPKKRKLDSETSENNFLHSNQRGTTSFRVPKWPFIAISTSEGERLYVKIKNTQSSSNEIITHFKNKKSKRGLLGISYNELKSLTDELDRGNLFSSSANDFLLEVEEEIFDTSSLWVEKFKPKTYFDLLSDEAVNRTLLNWLKTWDKVVFNKEPKEKVFNIQFKENDLKTNATKLLEPDGRPRYKVALLCGPPGLGKTTLAHIAAVMAGYNVIEVNASDDRSVEAISSKLDNATQMQTVMGKRKPHCLILDEVDGAPIQTIDFILKYLGGKHNQNTKKVKKDKVERVIKRPIICICNELYTPSLRNLRQQAFVIHFPNTSSTKLTQRLMEICKKQEIKTDLRALTLLCDKAQNDIRSCISTLHFFKNKKGERFKSCDVLKSVLGLKDVQKSVFNIWKEIFYNPVQKAGIFAKALNKASEDEVSAQVNYSKKGMERLESVVQSCQSSGDYDRLVEGIFENFLKSKFSGAQESIVEGLIWFSWFDLLDTTIKKKQNYSLLSYLPYSFAMWQNLFSSHSFHKIIYPSTGYENRIKEMKCNQILSDVSRGLNPTLRSFNQKQSLLFDVLPMIDVILKPNLRPVNPTLFNEEEKKDFKHLIDVMVEFNLNYVQQRSADGTYSYLLDPNVDELIKFNLMTKNNLRLHTYNMKQIISHHVDLEKMRRSEVVVENENTSLNLDTNESDDSRLQQNIKLTTLQPKEIQIKESNQYKDFFGRIVTRQESSTNAVRSKNNSAKSPIWFSFKEGYNNAVKKDITMKDLL